jgi:hypothetical protein
MRQYVSKFSGSELDKRLTRVASIPTKTSDLNNDSGFISEVEADNKYTDKNKTDALERNIKELKEKVDDIENNINNGGEGDNPSVEGFIPLSRDFSDDFNNDFAR